MTICSLDLPPSDNLNIVLLIRLIAQLPTPFVICGDFNGHSVTWGCDKNNSRGDRIDDFITDNNVFLLNSQRSRHIYCFSCRGQLKITNRHVTFKPVVI